MSSERVEARIPILEFSGEKVRAGSDSWNSTCQQVREAMEKYGCFELIYNKHTIEHHNSILQTMEELFNLPHEIKIKNTDPNFWYGAQSSLGNQQLKIHNTLNKEAWQNLNHLVWPHGKQHFCDTVHAYTKLMAEMHELVMKMLCDSYKIGKDYSESHIKSATYFMVLHKYERENRQDNNPNVNGHRDLVFLTILHQNHTKGLEISIKDGKEDRWVSYEPSSHSSFIVLAGDVCMGWSNDRIKSCFHRVVTKGQETRYSIGLFTYLEGLITIPKELVDEEHPLKYKPFENQPYLKFAEPYFSSTLSGENPIKYDKSVNILKAYCGI